jgi:hypothetical protein
MERIASLREEHRKAVSVWHRVVQMALASASTDELHHVMQKHAAWSHGFYKGYHRWLHSALRRHALGRWRDPRELAREFGLDLADALADAPRDYKELLASEEKLGEHGTVARVSFLWALWDAAPDDRSRADILLRLAGYVGAEHHFGDEATGEVLFLAAVHLAGDERQEVLEKAFGAAVLPIDAAVWEAAPRDVVRPDTADGPVDEKAILIDEAFKAQKGQPMCAAHLYGVLSERYPDDPQWSEWAYRRADYVRWAGYARAAVALHACVLKHDPYARHDEKRYYSGLVRDNRHEAAVGTALAYAACLDYPNACLWNLRAAFSYPPRAWYGSCPWYEYDEQNDRIVASSLKAGPVFMVMCLPVLVVRHVFITLAAAAVLVVVLVKASRKRRRRAAA